MKKKILVSVLAATALFGLASCDNEEEVVSLTNITIAGQETEFVVGDTFDDGDLVVTAAYSDGTTADVTANATITQSADMNKPGSYAVLVTYEDKVVAYQIVVSAKENVETLKGIEVYANDAKTSYLVGESLSTDGLKIYETYSNTVGADTVKTVDTTGYTVKVLNDNSEEVTEFNAVGSYTVVVSKGELSDSYEIVVSPAQYTTVALAIEAAYDNYDKVSNGSIVFNRNGYISNYEYAFGQNYTMVNSDGIKYHYSLLEDDSVFGLMEYEDGSIERAYYTTINNMYGVDLQGVTYYEYESFGLEQLLTDLYTVATSETVSDLVESINYCSTCGDVESYAFSFTTDLSGYTFRINVEFTIGDNNVLTSLNVDMDGYYITYDAYDQEIEAVIYNNLSATQVAGERVAESAYNVDDLLFTSFDVTDTEGNALTENTVTTDVGNAVFLKVANALPETANSSVDAIEILSYDADGFETYSVYAGYWDGEITITPYKAGTYTIEVKTTNVTKTITVIVNPAQLTSYAAGVPEYGDLYEATTATVFTGNTLQFGAVVNEYADNTSTVVVTPSENVTLDFDGEYHTFVATAVGEYVITLTSSVDPNFTATLTVTVEEAPSVADMLNGKYNFNNMMLGNFDFEFVPTSEGALEGTLNLVHTPGYIDDLSGTYTYVCYEMLGNYFEVKDSTGAVSAVLGLEFDDQMNLCLLYNGFNQGPLSKVTDSGNGEGGSENTGLNGVYSFQTTNMAGFPVNYNVTFNSDGTGNYDLQGSWYYGSFNYVADGGVITFTNVTPMLGTDEVILGDATYSGTTVTFVYTIFAGTEDEFTNTVDLTGADTGYTAGGILVDASWNGETYVYTAEEAGTYTFSVDESVAVIGYNFEMSPSHTITLGAGDTVELTILSNENNGIIGVTLFVTKA